VPGYAGWQAAVTAGLLVVAWALPTAWPAVLLATAPVTPPVTRPKWLRRWLRRLERALPERLWLTWRLLRLVWSPTYALARSAVRQAATAEGFRDKGGWAQVAQRMGRVAGVSENVWRHLAAVESFGQVPVRTGHLRGAALELAYLALKERGR
jgi:hypothetical protein